MVGTRRTAIAGLALLTLTACGSPPAKQSSSGESTASTSTGTGAMPPTPATSSAPTPPSCAEQTAANLTPKQKAAQLVLVAMTPSSTGTAAEQISNGNASGVFLLGGWTPDQLVQPAKMIHELSVAGAGIGTWVTIDQEGGAVQQLHGATQIPSALKQSGMAPDQLRAQAAGWASELKASGVDINLAPVADVVPASIGTKNAPIGLHDRQYGATPETVTPSLIAFMQGMQDSGIIPTIKHFPGIGRIAGNTDLTASGISDENMTAQDPLLQPFQQAIEAGAPIVMISTARYPQLDPDNQAAFSSAIITGLLREQMGFDGVTFTDDVGAAKAVADVPVADRITRFVAAGGDVVLTAQPAQAQTMNDAVVARYGADQAFAAQVDASVLRVLGLKDKQKLLPCSS